MHQDCYSLANRINSAGDPLWVMRRAGPCPRLFWAKGTGGWLVAVGPNAEPVAFAEDATGSALQTARWAEKDPRAPGPATWPELLI